MLAWDDFRIVKAIADCGSLAEAAAVLRLNQTTLLQKLDQIEQHLDAPLFKRSGSTLTLTPRGEEVVRLAGRIERDIEAFKQNKPAQAPVATGLAPAHEIAARSGLEFLADMIKGLLPQPVRHARISPDRSRRRLRALRW